MAIKGNIPDIGKNYIRDTRDKVLQEIKDRKAADEEIKKHFPVKTADIADGAVTEGKLADKAVSADKIQAGAVTQPKIQDGAVTEGKIRGGAVTEDKIADKAVSADKIQAGAVTQPKIQDGAVTEGKIRDGAVTESKLGANSVTSEKIKDGAVSTDDIADGAITTDKLSEDIKEQMRQAVADGVTYTLSKSGSKIQLKGSDESTSEVEDSDTTYTHPDTAGNKHIPSGGEAGQILLYGGSSGTAKWGSAPTSNGEAVTYTLSKEGSYIVLTGSDGSRSTAVDSNTMYVNATQSMSGLMSAEDKQKLDSLVDANAKEY